MRAPRKYGRNHERPLLWKTTVVEDYRGGKQLGWKAAAKSAIKLVLDTQKPGYFRNRAICGR